jgi:Mrp family chromosome partitioning ATPase
MIVRRFRHVVRQWRRIVVAGVMIGLVVGWVSAPGSDTGGSFEATTILFFDTRGGVSPIPAVVGATHGPVPGRVAARLGLDRQFVRSRVQAEFRPTATALLITGRSADPGQAEALANVTTEELVVELGGEKAPLRVLETAVASPAKSDDIVGPTSRPGRALLLGAFGLMLGISAAFVVELLDNRLRSKRAVEEIPGVRVIAELPPIPRSESGRLITAAQSPPLIEAFRGLRTSVDHWARQGDGDGRRVVLVTSPFGGEGATTAVAHLAATLGEVGRSVVVISADLRHPRLHLYFGKAREPGLTDVLRGAPDARRLADLNLATTVRGVQFVASGAPARNPSPLLDRIGDHVREARGMGDFVLIDAPPLLVTSEAADLARHADGVLLVVRSGWTSIGAVARSMELLERLNIPVLGAVLVGSVGSKS